MNMLPSFFYRNCCKAKRYSQYLRHVELTNDIVWRIEGFRGSIFIQQLIRAVELMLFVMKDRSLIFLAADNNQL